MTEIKLVTLAFVKSEEICCNEKQELSDDNFAIDNLTTSALSAMILVENQKFKIDHYKKRKRMKKQERSILYSYQEKPIKRNA